MIPFKKIAVLIIRTFSQPMLRYLRRKQQEKKLTFFSGFFIGLGRRTHILEHWINMHILKATLRKQPSRLNETILLEKGIESFYEFIFYGIVLGIPFYEMYKASVAT